MSFLLDLEPVKPVASLSEYLITLHAPSKFGKTTFAIDLIDKHYGGDMSKGIMLATEVGYKTANGLYAVPITGFKSAKEDDGKQRGFIETVNELITNKKEIPFEFVVIDTVTALERYATQFVLKRESRNDGKRYGDISDIAWGKGYSLVAEEIYEQLDRLQKAGFGVLLICHSKEKKVTTKSGFEYDYSTLNMLGKTADIIMRESDLIMHGDIVVEKGDQGKPVTSRKLRFRSDGNILCGSRFGEFPETIEHSADSFLSEFKKAVLNLYGNDQQQVDNAVQEQAEEKLKVEEVIESDATTKTAPNLHQEIKDTFSKLTLSEEGKVALSGKFKELLGTANYNKVNDVEKLEKALEYLKTLK